MLINMLVDFHHFLLFSFSLFYTLKFLIYYFQFVNSMHLFSLPIHPQEALKNWSIQCKPIALSMKCLIELLVYTVLQKYAHYQAETKPSEISTTLDIITRLLDNAAFVCLHVVGRFSKGFSEVQWLRSPGFQLQVEWMTTVLCVEL